MLLPLAACAGAASGPGAGAGSGAAAEGGGGSLYQAALLASAVDQQARLSQAARLRIIDHADALRTLKAAGRDTHGMWWRLSGLIAEMRAREDDLEAEMRTLLGETGRIAAQPAADVDREAGHLSGTLRHDGRQRMAEALERVVDAAAVVRRNAFRATGYQDARRIFDPKATERQEWLAAFDVP